LHSLLSCRGAALLLLLGACGFRQASQRPAPAGDTVVTTVEITAEPLRLEPGDLMPGQAYAMGARFAGIDVRPDTVFLTVGQTADLRAIEVSAVDSAGEVLGRLRTYDHGIRPGAAEMIGFMTVRGVQAGVSGLTITVSRLDWANSEDRRPTVNIPIVVRER